MRIPVHCATFRCTDRSMTAKNDVPGAVSETSTIPMVIMNPEERVGEWTVVTLLGQGAFGAVYQVINGTGKAYALKTENCNGNVRVLKMEVVVLQSLSKAKATHFCDVFDSGKARGFYYIVMTLIGKSLQDLRKTYKPSKLTMGCAISVGMQCLEAIQEIHNVGYLHRDIKPANFAISLENSRRVIMFDFGMCRKYVENDNTIRKPRTMAYFRGTLRYAPLCCHNKIEMSRKDDLESWVYQQVELTSGTMPWSHLVDFDAVKEMKTAAREGESSKQLFGDCPKEYLYLLIYVDSLGYYTDPKYSILRGLLRDALNNNGLKEFPYDWETK